MMQQQQQQQAAMLQQQLQHQQQLSSSLSSSLRQPQSLSSSFAGGGSIGAARPTIDTTHATSSGGGGSTAVTAADQGTRSTASSPLQLPAPSPSSAASKRSPAPSPLQQASAGNGDARSHSDSRAASPSTEGAISSSGDQPQLFAAEPVPSQEARARGSISELSTLLQRASQSTSATGADDCTSISSSSSNGAPQQRPPLARTRGGPSTRSLQPQSQPQQSPPATPSNSGQSLGVSYRLSYNYAPTLALEDACTLVKAAGGLPAAIAQVGDSLLTAQAGLPGIADVSGLSAAGGGDDDVTSSFHITRWSPLAVSAVALGISPDAPGFSAITGGGASAANTAASASGAGSAGGNGASAHNHSNNNSGSGGSVVAGLLGSRTVTRREEGKGGKRGSSAARGSQHSFGPANPSLSSSFSSASPPAHSTAAGSSAALLGTSLPAASSSSLSSPIYGSSSGGSGGRQSPLMTPMGAGAAGGIGASSAIDHAVAAVGATVAAARSPQRSPLGSQTSSLEAFPVHATTATGTAPQQQQPKPSSLQPSQASSIGSISDLGVTSQTPPQLQQHQQQQPEDTFYHHDDLLQPYQQQNNSGISGLENNNSNNDFDALSEQGRQAAAKAAAVAAAEASVRSQIISALSAFATATSGPTYARRAVIQIGVIDILQPYDLSKQVENAFKSMRHTVMTGGRGLLSSGNSAGDKGPNPLGSTTDLLALASSGASGSGAEISSVDPNRYAARFLDFARRVFVPVAIPVPNARERGSVPLMPLLSAPSTSLSAASTGFGPGSLNAGHPASYSNGAVGASASTAGMLSTVTGTGGAGYGGNGRGGLPSGFFHLPVVEGEGAGAL